jgi:hypothetical protein
VGPLDAVWHLLNFFAPAFGVGCITALLASLVWRKSVRIGLLRLAAWASLGGALGLIAALVLFGRDGKMAGYGLMIGCIAVAVWWRGLRSPTVRRSVDT